MATVSVALTTGGRWIPDFDASKVVNHPWGTFTFAFTGCNSGRVDFTSTYPGYGSNHMDLTRLTMPAGLTCTSTANVSALKGLWTGSTSLDESVVAVVIEDGTYEIVYSKPATSGDAGVIRGTSSADGGKFSSSDARNFPVAQAQEATGFSSIAAVDGTFVPGSQLHLTMTTRTATRTLAATYVAGSDQPPSLAVPAGAYTGFTGHVGGRQEAAYTIDAAGHIAGVNAATCTFSGTITPRASVRVFDWTLVATNDHCIFGTGPLSGIAYYDDASRQIHAFATFSADGAPDQYFMIGTKN